MTRAARLRKEAKKARREAKRFAEIEKILLSDPVERKRREAERKRQSQMQESREAGFSQKYVKRIHSAEWKVFRMTIMAQRGAKCEQCPAVRNIQLHHLTYERLGNELPQDVMLLCDDCHRGIHGHATAKPVRKKGKPLTPVSYWERASPAVAAEAVRLYEAAEELP